MMNEIVTKSEDTTAYQIGMAKGILLNLRRMVELNMEEYDLPRAKGLAPLFTKKEIMDEFAKALSKLELVTFPFKV